MAATPPWLSSSPSRVRPDSVLAKTQKAFQELETRANKLDQRLRTLLIMVNGKATAGEIARQFEKVGDVTPLLQQLLEQGYVAESEAAPSAAELKRAQLELCSHLSNLLGPDADPITGRLEKCKSVAEMRQFLQERRAVLDQALGKTKSGQFWAKADAYLR